MSTMRIAALLLACLLLAACAKPTEPTPNEPATPPAQTEKAPAQTETPPVTQPPAAPKEKGTQPVTGLFEKVALKAGDPLPGVGLYFIDTATGTAEGWRPLPPLMHPTYRVSDDNRFIGAQVDGSYYLIDRASGATAAVGGFLVAAGGGRLLMNEAGNKPSPRFFVLDTEQNLITRFTLPRAGLVAQAVMSPDGAKAMLATYSPQGSQAFLYLVDLAAGKADLVADLESAVGDREIYAGALTAIPGTQELFFSLSSYAYAPGTPGSQSLLLRVDWQGKKLLEKRVEGRAVQVSPDGKYLYWLADVAGYPGAVVVADLNGEPLFRAKVFTMGVDWLTDGSGFLVNDQGTYKQVTARGEVEPFALCARVDCRAGLTPVPDRTDLYLIGHEKLVSTDGQTHIAVAHGAGQTRIVDWLKPFGETSRELRVQVEPARNGDGWDGYHWALPLHIERPPFDDRLVVKGTGDCLNLRERPDLNAAVRACVPDGTPLTVAENTGTERTSLLWGDGGQWVYVKTQRGEQGWAALWSGYVTWLR